MARVAKVNPSDVIAELEKSTGINIGNARHAVKPVTGLSTGNIVVDHLTGIGGIPAGRITEVYGYNASGKSSVAVQTAATLQKTIIKNDSKDKILFLDHEHAIDLDYIENLGVDLDHCDEDGIPSFIISQPHYLEQGSEIAFNMLKKLPVKLMIFDSVAEMFPKDQEEGDFFQRTDPARRAQMIKALLMLLSGGLSEKDCAAIFINHLSMSIPMKWGERSKEQNPGGKGLPYHSSLRLKFEQADKESSLLFNPLTGVDEKQVSSVNTRVTVTKNKVGRAYSTADIRMDLGRGFNNAFSALQVLKDNKRIRVDGAWYYFTPMQGIDLSDPDIPVVKSKGEPGFQGEAEVLAFADRKPTWRNRLIDSAHTVIVENISKYQSNATALNLTEYDQEGNEEE